MQDQKNLKANKRSHMEINNGLKIYKNENATPNQMVVSSIQKCNEILTPRRVKSLFKDHSDVINKSEYNTPTRIKIKEPSDMMGKFNNQKQKCEEILTPRRGKTFIKESAEIFNKSLLSTPIRSRITDFSDKLDLMGKMHVAVRIRPLTSNESASIFSYPFEISNKTIIVKNNYDISAGMVTSYVYDNVFWSSKDGVHEFSSQKNVFDRVALPLLNSALEGYNACLFAYGQTGSGKTYSMMGYDDTFNREEAGIIPRFCNELLKQIPTHKSKLEMEISYFEIYNEKIHDLLSISCEGDKKTCLRVREHPLSGPYVEDLSTHKVFSLEKMKTLLAFGNTRRATSSTAHNDRSSRSHTILEIIVYSCSEDRRLHSKVSLVDLAGSERVASCHISGERFKEGLSINKSLLTLGKVIASLSDIKKGNFVPYRESVLTWLLKESLGGNSQTVMLATVSPSPLALEETLATLRYACQARHIVNKVVVNEDPQLKMIRELRQEVERLKMLREDFTNQKKNHSELDGGTSDHSDLNSAVSISNQASKLLNLEMQQKAAEERLQIELSRLGMSLEVAEKRRDELESQKKVFLKKIQNKRVSVYQTDFYDHLQNILNDSVDGNHIKTETGANENEVLLHLENMKKSIEGLQSACSTMLDQNIFLRRTLPVLDSMQKNYQELYDIFIVNNFAKS